MQAHGIAAAFDGLGDDDGGEVIALEAGSMFVVPRGHWHRHRHRGHVKELYLTPGRSEMSFEEDPPRAGR